MVLWEERWTLRSEALSWCSVLGTFAGYCCWELVSGGRPRGGGLVRQAPRKAVVLLSATAVLGLSLRLTFLRWLHLMEMPGSGC